MRILGIDIGGTAIKWGIEENGEFVDTGTRPSRASEGAEALLDNVFDLMGQLRFDLVGISTAGIVAPDGSIFYANENIPGYTGVKLKAIIEQRYGKPAAVINDIAAAAYSERGGLDDYYYLALGTGVGGMYVKDGKICSGSTGVAGQVGYLPSASGGIVDFDASTRGLRTKWGADTRELFSLAEGGSREAEECLSLWCRDVAMLIMQIVGFINPSAIVIGGGISEQGNALTGRIEKQLEELLPIPYKSSLSIRCARGGNLAGVMGVINYAKEKMI